MKKIEMLTVLGAFALLLSPVDAGRDWTGSIVEEVQDDQDPSSLDGREIVGEIQDYPSDENASSGWGWRNVVDSLGGAATNAASTLGNWTLKGANVVKDAGQWGAQKAGNLAWTGAEHASNLAKLGIKKLLAYTPWGKVEVVTTDNVQPAQYRVDSDNSDSTRESSNRSYGRYNLRPRNNLYQGNYRQ